jgi:hypothetical protein
MQLVIICCGKCFRYKTLLIFAYLLNGICLCLLPLATIYISGLGGFIISCLIVTLMGKFISNLGLGDALILSSLSGLASYLQYKFFVKLLTGFGFAGFTMNMIKLVLLILFGDHESEEKTVTSCLIFFTFSTVLLFICALFVIV